MNSRRLVIGIFLFLIAMFVMLAILVFSPLPATGYQTGFVEYPAGQKIDVLIADSELKRKKGLSGRSELLPNEGMLFEFEKSGYHGIWMFEMNFPIDIIWIEEGMIVDIVENAPAPVKGMEILSFQPKHASTHVLEVPAGSVKRNGLEEGAILRFEY